MNLLPGQKPPPGDWLAWLLLGGRGAGKLYAGVAWLCEKAWTGRRLALVVPDDFCVRIVERVVELSGQIGPGQAVEANRPYGIRWPNGAFAHVVPAYDIDRLRGTELDGALVVNLHLFGEPDRVVQTLRFALRGLDSRMMATAAPGADLARLFGDRCVVTRLGMFENPNLPPDFAGRLGPQQEKPPMWLWDFAAIGVGAVAGYLAMLWWKRRR